MLAFSYLNDDDCVGVGVGVEFGGSAEDGLGVGELVGHVPMVKNKLTKNLICRCVQTYQAGLPQMRHYTHSPTVHKVHLNTKYIGFAIQGTTSMRCVRGTARLTMVLGSVLILLAAWELAVELALAMGLALLEATRRRSIDSWRQDHNCSTLCQASRL